MIEIKEDEFHIMSVVRFPEINFHRLSQFSVLVVLAFCLVLAAGPPNALANTAGNTIRKHNFNFGHQLGYLYLDFQDAAFLHSEDYLKFTVGAGVQHTPNMPLVANPDWQKYTLILVPLELQYVIANRIRFQANWDLIAQLPVESAQAICCNSPRFRTQLRIFTTENGLYTLAGTVGVKFSSAKQWTLWNGKHNYIDSNGLVGPGTGVTDYWIELQQQLQIQNHNLHLTIGLAPVGDPTATVDTDESQTAFRRQGGAQADQLLLRGSWEFAYGEHRLELGARAFLGTISTTSLDTNIRMQTNYNYSLSTQNAIEFSVFGGLTDSSDRIGGSIEYQFTFFPKYNKQQDD